MVEPHGMPTLILPSPPHSHKLEKLDGLMWKTSQMSSPWPIIMINRSKNNNLSFAIPKKKFSIQFTLEKKFPFFFFLNDKNFPPKKTPHYWWGTSNSNKFYLTISESYFIFKSRTSSYNTKFWLPLNLVNGKNTTQYFNQ